MEFNFYIHLEWVKNPQEHFWQLQRYKQDCLDYKHSTLFSLQFNEISEKYQYFGHQIMMWEKKGSKDGPGAMPDFLDTQSQSCS